MKNGSAHQDDAELRQVLHQWEVNEPLPPGFPASVWRRIARQERARSGSIAQVLAWIESMLVRPAIATAYLALLLTAGLSAGYWHSQAYASRSEALLRAQYVQSLDPYHSFRH